MAIGTLLERLFVSIKADLTGLVSETRRGVQETKRATDQITTEWNQVGTAIDNATARAGRGMMVARGNMAGFARSTNMARAQMLNLGFQLQDIGVSLASGMNPLMVLVQQGSQIQQIYGGQGGMRALFGDLAKIGMRLAPVAAVVGAIAGGFKILQGQIQATTDTQITFGDTVKAVFQVASEAIWGWLQGPVNSIIEFFKPILQWLLDAWKTAWNNIIGAAVFAYNAVTKTWGLLPGAMKDLIAMAVNAVIQGTENMVNAVIEKLQQLLNLVNQGAEFLGFEKIFDDINNVDLSGFKMEVTGAAQEVGQILQEELDKAFGRDYLGEAFEAIRNQAIENALKRIAAETENVGKAAKKTGEKIKKNIEDPLKTAADNLAAVFGNAFEKLATEGKLTFNDFIQDLNRLLVASVSKMLQENLSNLFQGMFGGAGQGGGLFSGLVNIFTTLFGGGRAGGGVVMPWKSFIAGERGAELIEQDGPGGARRVTPAGRTSRLLAGAGAQGSPVYVNFNMPPGTDMNQFKRSEGQITSMMARAVDRGRRNQ